MIPVIGTAVIGNPFWVERLIASVDFPTENFLIVNNSQNSETIKKLTDLSNKPHEYIKKISILNFPNNMGVAASWNIIIKSFLNSPYWIITNDDICFENNFLKEIFETAESNTDVGMIHGDEGVHSVGSWDIFLIRDYIIQNFGLFDENFYPAYNEDADYIMKFVHRPIKKILSLKTNYMHGHEKKGNYESSGQQTKKISKQMEDKLNTCLYMNFDYMTKKWGKEWRMCWPYKTPYDKQEFPVDYSHYDLNFIREKYKIFNQ